MPFASMATPRENTPLHRVVKAMTERPGLLSDLRDKSKFRTIESVAVFDAHAPIPKTVNMPSARTATNPTGARTIMVGCTENELYEMAGNTNEDCSAGRFPAVKLGHATDADAGLPEHQLARHVGFAHSFAVQRFPEGPCLTCHLAVRPDEYSEARTYPRVSIERDGIDRPGQQRVKAVALLRRPVERDTLPVVRYGRDLPWKSSVDLDREANRTVMTRELIRANAEAREAARASLPSPGQVLRKGLAEVQQVAEFAAKNHVYDPAKARRLYDEANRAGTLSYAAGRSLDEIASQERLEAEAEESRQVIDYCVRKKIADVSMGRRLFHAENPGKFSALSYSANGVLPEGAFGQDAERLGSYLSVEAKQASARAEEDPPKPITTLPTNPAKLDEILKGEGFRRAVYAYASANNQFDAQRAGDSLIAEIRAGIVGIWPDGRLYFPPGDKAVYRGQSKTPLTPRQLYNEARSDFWSKQAVERAKAAQSPFRTPPSIVADPQADQRWR